MKLHFLTLTILNLSAALDSGHYDSLSVDEAYDMIKSGDLIRALQKRCGQHTDFSFALAAPHMSSSSYTDAMNTLMLGGDARRKWGIENRGLCLLMSWTNELIQQRLFID